MFIGILVAACYSAIPHVVSVFRMHNLIYSRNHKTFCVVIFRTIAVAIAHRFMRSRQRFCNTVIRVWYVLNLAIQRM